MPINFATSIFPLYATNVITDAAYVAVPITRRDSTFEQNLLTQIEVTRAMMETLADEDQARMFHYAMARMLAGVAIDRIYDDLTVTVTGNVAQPQLAVTNGNTLRVITTTGTNNITLAGAPFATLDALIAAINAGFTTVTQVRAFNNQGRLEFRNVAPHIGVQFELGYHTGVSLLDKLGIPAGVYRNPIVKRSNEARDDALSHFQRVANPLIP
jgi:hypothetical protein